MCQRGYACRRPIRRPTRQSTEATRHQLAVLIVALFGLCCVMPLFVPDSPTLDRMLPFMAQQLAMVIGYYFGRRRQ